MAFEPKRRDARTSRFFENELTNTLLKWSAEEAPKEACGLLFARKLCADGKADTLEKEAIRAVLIPNAACNEDSKSKFEFDSAAWVAEESNARGRGEVLVGIWHSHPDGPPRPSGEDVRGAEMLPSDFAYLVVDLSSLESPAAVTVWQRR
ncbi:MAG: M67 family metallopeptidase [Planctomycetota bacterium]|nr:M67 family metallopeptidase [Planctomycetota bacterium]